MPETGTIAGLFGCWCSDFGFSRCCWGGHVGVGFGLCGHDIFNHLPHLTSKLTHLNPYLVNRIDILRHEPTRLGKLFNDAGGKEIWCNRKPDQDQNNRKSAPEPTPLNGLLFFILCQTTRVICFGTGA